MEWKLAEAKNKFSEVVRRALTEGPQRIRRRDSVVVVLSEDDFERLAGIRIDFKDFLLDGPDTHSLDLERSHDSMREIEL
ncbi:MAG: type II toxin-antitoxin system prevent-host-death family antitoxin [Planctomycetota bacterium]